MGPELLGPVKLGRCSGEWRLMLGGGRDNVGSDRMKNADKGFCRVRSCHFNAANLKAEIRNRRGGMLDFGVFEDFIPDQKERRRVCSKKNLAIRLLPWGSVCCSSFVR